MPFFLSSLTFKNCSYWCKIFLFFLIKKFFELISKKSDKEGDLFNNFLFCKLEGLLALFFNNFIFEFFLLTVFEGFIYYLS